MSSRIMIVSCRSSLCSRRMSQVSTRRPGSSLSRDPLLAKHTSLLQDPSIPSQKHTFLSLSLCMSVVSTLAGSGEAGFAKPWTDICLWTREIEEKQKRKLLLEQNRMSARAEKEEGYSLAKRLAKFAGPSALNRNHFRVTAAGTPKGLLMGLPTFLKAQEREDKETKKVLSALERGSSSALSSFQEVLVI